MTPESTVGPVRNGSSSGRNPLIAFFILAYLISWGLWLSLVTLSLSLKDPLRGLINGLAIFGPTLAGLILIISRLPVLSDSPYPTRYDVR